MRPELLDAAQRAADWYLARLPSDRVPYWDFEAPDIPRAPRDASAAAIAASGLVELGRLTAEERGAGYRRAAQDILASLASSYLTLGTPNQAVLAHSVGSFPQDSEVDVGLVYADYYLLRPSADYTGSSDQSLENAAAGARCREARSANDSVATRVRRGSV